MDDMDRKILRLLQEDSSISVSDIARQVGLSASPCWKRINRMQTDGLIKRQVAVLDADKLGYGLTVFVSIKTGEHSADWLQTFAKTVEGMPEVLEFHRMAGEVDYLLKVVVPDMRSFDLFYKNLVELTALSEVTSRFSMETIKDTTALPV
ncbi:Lrp/AsnC family transcriptional regulator [Nisaea acidiphila]|uniref:Lrp/AsnC family transcriptional regulator n=1 Tax=Nisaea acidiphila TaxID=1862145 RepID=A0A9J7ATU2_9PROT|nr:Lrp/AsnC family transcriptional regulator [Nisaea acidiphila]UUX49905.1 Lrp/AsnC family transcriptional regulator [Nisaea acidiphila]